MRRGKRAARQALRCIADRDADRMELAANGGAGRPAVCVSRLMSSHYSHLLMTSVCFAFRIQRGYRAVQHSEAEKFMALEHAWGEALIKADIAALDQILADEYMFTGPTGAVATKGPHLQDVETGTFKVIATEISDVSVRIYDTTAIVTGLNKVTANYLDRKINGNFRFSDTFVNRDGRWQVVNAHSSQIIE